MTKREVAELAVRILALTIVLLEISWLLFLPAQLLGALFALVRGGPAGLVARDALLFGSVTSVLTLALVCFLWVRAEWIAGKLTSQRGESSRWPHVRAADLQTAAFSTVGLVALLLGAQGLARSLGYYLDRMRLAGVRYIDLGEWVTSPDALEGAMTLALGIWLVLGSRQIVRSLKRWQTSRRGEPSEEPVGS